MNEHPVDFQGAIRMTCSQEGFTRFQSVWQHKLKTGPWQTHFQSDLKIAFQRLGKYNQQDNEETLGQIDEESEDQIPNNDVGEEVHMNNNVEWIFECWEVIVFWGTDVPLFNLLKVTSDVDADCLGPRTKIKGKLKNCVIMMLST